MKVKILMHRHSVGDVFIDDVRVNKVASFEFSAGVGKANMLTVVLKPDEVEIDAAEADVNGD